VIKAKGMLRRRPYAPHTPEDVGDRVIGCDVGSEDGHQNQEDDDDQTNDRHAVGAKTPPGLGEFGPVLGLVSQDGCMRLFIK